MRKVQRGHSKPASFSAAAKAGDGADGTGELVGASKAVWDWGRRGVGPPTPGVAFKAGLLVALDIVAFNTCVKAGLIPHARQGGRGVCAWAVEGSKLEGTGFGKLQMVQTQVAEVVGAGLAVNAERYLGSEPGTGEAALLLDGLDAAALVRDTRDTRFGAFGIRVILGDDLRKPAWLTCFSDREGPWFVECSLHSDHIFQHPSDPGQRSAFWAPAYRHSICDARSSRPGHPDDLVTCIS